MRDQCSPPTLEECARFLSKVERLPGPDGCFLYHGFLWPSGYGQFKFRGHPWRAHRFAWLIVNGPIPDGVRVCHRCDIRQCVRVAHLWLGSDLENTRDAWRKGRGVGNIGRRELHRMAKLTWPQVRAIRTAVAGGETYPSVAARYGVNQATVSSIVLHKTWRE